MKHPTTPLAEWTTEEKTALLADFMGWSKGRIKTKGNSIGQTWLKDDSGGWKEEIAGWKPYKDWNHARMVEEKVMEDGKLWTEVCYSYEPNEEGLLIFSYMKSDLPTRMDSACQCILDRSQAAS